MPKEINPQQSAQQRSAKLLAAMAIVVIVGIAAYLGLSLYAGRRTPAQPDTTYTAENGITISYESALWPVCEMAEDETIGNALMLASGEDASDNNYQIVTFQRGKAGSGENFIEQSEEELRDSYGVISPKKLSIEVEGATVTAVRCDIQAYYAVLAVVEYDSGDVVCVSGLTKLASINDILNLIEDGNLTLS